MRALLAAGFGLISFGLLAQAPATALSAQTHSTTPHANSSQQDHLVFTLILSRHGVRPPLAPNDSLAQFSTAPWPAWEVPLGHLTPHGAEAITQMGAYLRADLARSGLIAASSCPAPGDIYLYSDTDERNLSSTRAAFAGFETAGCVTPPINMYVGRQKPDGSYITRDPLFVPLHDAIAPPPAEESLAAERAAMHGDPQTALTAAGEPELNELAHVLAPDAAHPPAAPINSLRVAVTANPSGDPIVSFRGPLEVGYSLAEDFLLEYADNKPLSEVAFGRFSNDAQAEAAIRRMVALNVDGFIYAARSPYFARLVASNLMSHIMATLDRATLKLGAPSSAPVRDSETEVRVGSAFGPTGTKLVYIYGHDTNLHAIAGMLGLNWSDPLLTSNDTPPDSQIVFELWQNARTKRTTIRIKFVAQTLAQLRSAAPLTGTNKPVEILLTPPGCNSATACSYAAFEKAAAKAIDPHFVLQGPLVTQSAP